MSTKKKEDAAAGSAYPREMEAYEAALARFEVGLERIAAGDFAAAKQIFDEVVTRAAHEPELAQRSRTYSAICDRRLASPPADPASPDERYTRAVFHSNAGQWDLAIRLLDTALAENPGSVRCLYARACAFALKGSADKAVADLRQAIALDPKVRYQAVNDPDFERIREEPAFIDVIEPTPTGA